MGPVGCYVTTLASGLRSFYMKDTDPGRLCDALNRVGGFVEGQLNWSALPSVIPGTALLKAGFVKLPTDPNTSGYTIDATLKTIRNAVAKGLIVGIIVDFVKTDNQPYDHIVLAVETPEGGDWTIMDPAFGKVMQFSEKYGQLEDGVKGFRIFGGTPASFPSYSTRTDEQAGIAIGLGIDPRYTKKDMVDVLLGS